MAIPKLMQEAMSEFTVEKFWTVGVICFLVIAAMGILGIYLNWEITKWYQKVAGIFTARFQLSLAYLFYWLLKNSKSKNNGAIEDFAQQLESDEDMIKLMEGLKNKTPEIDKK